MSIDISYQLDKENVEEDLTENLRTQHMSSDSNSTVCYRSQPSSRCVVRFSFLMFSMGHGSVPWTEDVSRLALIFGRTEYFFSECNAVHWK